MIQKKYLKSYASSKNFIFLRNIGRDLFAFIFFVGVINTDWFIEKKYEKGDNYLYEDPFQNFLEAQNKPGANFYEAFENLEVTRSFIPSKLANNFYEDSDFNNDCEIEQISFKPAHTENTSKELVYFYGGITCLQHQMRLLSNITKETGFNVHSFNYPGIAASTGKTREFNDLVNSGISVVKNLLETGKHESDIILQGHCLGGNVALAVKNFFLNEYCLDLKLVLFDTPKSLANVFADSLSYILSFLPQVVFDVFTVIFDFFLNISGWNVSYDDSINKFEFNKQQMHFYQGGNNLSLYPENTLHNSKLDGSSDLLTELYDKRALILNKDRAYENKKQADNSHVFTSTSLKTSDGVSAIECLKQFALAP